MPCGHGENPHIKLHNRNTEIPFDAMVLARADPEDDDRAA